MHAAFVLLPVVIWLLFCLLVGRSASSFQRSPFAWFLLSLLISPLIAYLLLLFVGNPQEAISRREKEERIRQKYPERKDIREAAMNETKCPHCGAEVNPITMDGLHSPDAVPWLLICKKCRGKIEPDV